MSWAPPTRWWSARPRNCSRTTNGRPDSSRSYDRSTVPRLAYVSCDRVNTAARGSNERRYVIPVSDEMVAMRKHTCHADHMGLKPAMGCLACQSWSGPVGRGDDGGRGGERAGVR